MVFGFCYGKANMAKEEYQGRYPQRRHAVRKRHRETGTSVPNYRNGGGPKSIKQLVEKILDAIRGDSTSSMRQIALELNILSKTTCIQYYLRIFCDHFMQPLYMNDNIHRTMQLQ